MTYFFFHDPYFYTKTYFLVFCYTSKVSICCNKLLIQHTHKMSTHCPECSGCQQYSSNNKNKKQVNNAFPISSTMENVLHWYDDLEECTSFANELLLMARSFYEKYATLRWQRYGFTSNNDAANELIMRITEITQVHSVLVQMFAHSEKLITQSTKNGKYRLKDLLTYMQDTISYIHNRKTFFDEWKSMMNHTHKWCLKSYDEETSIFENGGYGR